MPAPASLRFDVTSERGTYPVVVGSGLLKHPADTLAEFGFSGQHAIVSAAPIWKLHGHAWKRVAGRQGPILIADGEKSKTLASVSRIYSEFHARSLDRRATVIAVGGGVVGDVAGFAAASYLRGLPVVQAPTTLLAQVDSSIGGKTGVNLAVGKNLVGAFHAPAAVLCDPLVLATLAPREFRSGLYEVIKYGVIAAPDLLDAIEQDLPEILRRNVAVLTPLIARCCEIKARVVMADERENGPRRALNFGHTLGHALEAVTRYRRLRHGEAVGYGMLAAANISLGRGLMTSAEAARLAAIIHSLGPMPAVADLKSSDLLNAAAHDKKVLAGRLHFVAAQHLGATMSLTDVTRAELVAGIRAMSAAIAR